MNKIKRQTIIGYLKVTLWIPVLLGWWGFLFPDTTINADTCSIVCESGERVEHIDYMECYKNILSATPGQIRVKSRLYELFFQRSDMCEKAVE